MGTLMHRVMVTELKAKRSHGPRWALIERGAEHPDGREHECRGSEVGVCVW